MDAKTHKINLVLSTDTVWKSDDVASQVEDILVDMNDGGEDPGPFEDIRAYADPVNEDVPVLRAVEDTLNIVAIYISAMRSKVDEYNALDMFREGIEKVEHGLTDLKACLRCINHLESRVERLGMQVVGMDELGDAPEDVLHAVAHKMGLGRDECIDMSRDDIIDWIKGKGKETVN